MGLPKTEREWSAIDARLFAGEWGPAADLLKLRLGDPTKVWQALHERVARLRRESPKRFPQWQDRGDHRTDRHRHPGERYDK